jgi:hypothetical protein
MLLVLRHKSLADELQDKKQWLPRLAQPVARPRLNDSVQSAGLTPLPAVMAYVVQSDQRSRA